MPYRSPVTAPRARCTSRVVVLVLLPPAFTEVISVASRGTVVINPKRWCIFSMWVRLSSKACWAALLCVSVLEKPKSSSEGSVLLGDGAFGRVSDGVCCAGPALRVRGSVCWLPAVRVTFATAAPSPSAVGRDFVLSRGEVGDRVEPSKIGLRLGRLTGRRIPNRDFGVSDNLARRVRDRAGECGLRVLRVE
jgi:hypothetical protein